MKNLQNVYMAKLNTRMSFNALIWERAPKVFLSLPEINLAVYDAVSVFNDGRRDR